MKANKVPIRAVGQRSITSTFLFRPSNRSSDCEKNAEFKGPKQEGSRITLSDFLNRKLHRSSVLPTSPEVNEPPLSSPLRGDNLDRIVKGESAKNEGREAEVKVLIDGAFDLFKNVERGKSESKNSYSTNETEIIDIDDYDDIQQTRKRKFLFEGNDDKPTPRKRVVVLGEDSKPMQCSRRKGFAREEARPIFNHYKNGGGWWNEDMEGVDNEEVGCNNAWEGVGCTSLGGIEWH